MVKVLTLNLWNITGPWERRRELVREWIGRLDPDLIGFQEVVVGGGFDQAAELVDDGYHRVFGPAGAFWLDASRQVGVAAVSRWPVDDRELVVLPGSDDEETRVALSVTVDAPLGPISFTVTHLNWQFHHGAIRERQVVSVCDLVLRRRPRDGFPPVLVGDFNAIPESSEIRYLTGLQTLEGRSRYLYDAWAMAGDGGPGTTWANRNDYARGALEPDRRIDYIFAGYPTLDGIGRIAACRVVCDEAVDGVWPSDHFGVYAELTTEPDPDRLEMLRMIGEASA